MKPRLKLRLRLPLSLLSSLAFGTPVALAACTTSTTGETDAITKDEARASGGKSDLDEDYCAMFGWYGDAICDDFCPEPDPDCLDACPDSTDPHVHYVLTDPDVCARSLIGCDEGQTFFTGDCGCGCIDPEPDPDPPMCPDATDPRVHYVLHSADECAVALIGCDPGQTFFTGECGCGCLDPDPTQDPPPPPPSGPVCPDPSDPNVHYILGSHDDPSVCFAILFSCDPGQTLFSNACGCGCIDP